MPPTPEPPPAEVSEEGVDLTLIRAFLALTPAQRLEAIEDRQADLERIREYQRGWGHSYSGPLPLRERRA